MISERGPRLESIVRDTFSRHGLHVHSIYTRNFPNEVIVIVEVPREVMPQAVQLANSSELDIDSGFVTVRPAPEKAVEAARGPVKTVADDRVTSLIELLSSRSRTTEQQPSLRYIRDLNATVNVVASPRHHLVFGRRGVGKTALLLEARRLLDRKPALTLWINLQTFRGMDAPGAFLNLVTRVTELPVSAHAARLTPPISVRCANELRDGARRALQSRSATRDYAPSAVAGLHDLFRVFSAELQTDIYLFLDDIHYLAMDELPRLLDMIHGATRDQPVWIKAAGIKHQCRWFSDTPPTGLQIGHDAQEVNLDVTLEDPARAREFLENVFKTYVAEVGIKRFSGFLASRAIDRLVLASGGVPRDFLTLAAAAIQVTRARGGSQTGAQDVNQAAGQAAASKRQELEDDAASARGAAPARNAALAVLADFLVTKKSFAFFRVDLLDKEQHPQQYELLQSLMDLRFVHLLNASVSDAHQAGRRYEVYMLDLSLYSGRRFKQNLTVLDLEGANLVMKKTRSGEAPKTAKYARELTAIFRSGPVVELRALHPAEDKAQLAHA